MPRNPKGELNLTEIRNLARQHNKLSNIAGIDTKSRANLLKEIGELGYRVDHAGKRIVKTFSGLKKMAAEGKTKVSVGTKGDKKPQKRTIIKRRRTALKKGTGKGGGNPIYVKDRAEDEV